MVNNIVIVGGGTAGWMTATYLQRSFGDRVSITLVESARVGTVGVGEATFSTIRQFFAHLGLDESEWMPACNATYKLAIRFEDWERQGAHFYHPFERPQQVEGFPLSTWWLKLSDGQRRFDEECLTLPHLCEAKLSPRHLDGSLFQSEPDGGDADAQFPYAYHFDAGLLADFLAEYGRQRGVRHVVDDVVEVGQDERGWITHVDTAEHGRLAGDLFVDCTGFLGLLISKHLDEPFESFQDVLPNNRAVALRVPVDLSADGIAPYTTATAADSGWIWTIPLYGRNGMGYVYSDEFCEPEEAERVLRDFAGPPAEDLDALHLRMRIGRHRRSWVANCVAIGLASGFVEPLESTGIFFIQHGAEQLVRHFPDGSWDPGLRDAYNRRIAECIDGVKEFLVLHYRAAAREDTPYWKATKTRPIPDGLAERLERWRSQLPDGNNVYPHYHGFDPYSYEVMLLGLGFRPQRHPGALDLLDAGAARSAFAEVRAAARHQLEGLPTHAEYVASLRSEELPARLDAAAGAAQGV